MITRFFDKGHKHKHEFQVLIDSNKILLKELKFLVINMNIEELVYLINIFVSAIKSIFAHMESMFIS